MLAPPLVACSKFLRTKSTAIRKFSGSFSGDRPAMRVTSTWHRGSRRLACRIAGRDTLELGRDTRDWGLSEVLDAGLAADKLEGGLYDKLDDGRCARD